MASSVWDLVVVGLTLATCVGAIDEQAMDICVVGDETTESLITQPELSLFLLQISVVRTDLAHEDGGKLQLTGNSSMQKLGYSTNLQSSLLFWSGLPNWLMALLWALLWIGLAFLIMKVLDFYNGRAPVGNVPSWGSRIGEFLGTSILVLAVGCARYMGGAYGPAFIAVILAGAISGSLWRPWNCFHCWKFASISGSHFNPGVSLAFALVQMMRGVTSPYAKSAVTAVNHIGLQLAGAICGGLLYAAIAPLLGQPGHLGEPEGHSWIQIGSIEMLYTFMLALAALSTSEENQNKKTETSGSQALAVGFVYLAGGYGAGEISGSFYNPAVSLGMNVAASGMNHGLTSSFLYLIVFELAGACLAGMVYVLLQKQALFGWSCLVGKLPKFLAEFLGTFLLVLTIALNSLMGFRGAVVSNAAALMCLVFTLGPYSGGHFNPAVTGAFALVSMDDHGIPQLSGHGKWPSEKTFLTGETSKFGRPILMSIKAFFAWNIWLYFIAQFLGSICAGFLAKVLASGTAASDLEVPVVSVMNCIEEGFSTGLLCFAMLYMGGVRQGWKGCNWYLREYFGILVACVALAGFLTYSTASLGSLNPAATSAFSLARIPSNLGRSSGLLVLSQFAGAGISSGAYALVSSTFLADLSWLD